MERVEGIEPSSSAWKAAALPLSYTRNRSLASAVGVAIRTSRVVGPVRLRPNGASAGHHSPLREEWWKGLDSNQRTLSRADLQSAAINHSATLPAMLPRSLKRL